MNDNPKAPAGVDYALAVECSGLTTAIDSLRPRLGPLRFGIAYSAWAHSLAVERDPSAVDRAIAARRESFLREAGDGVGLDQHLRLPGKYEATREGCVASARLRDDVVVITSY